MGPAGALTAPALRAAATALATLGSVVTAQDAPPSPPIVTVADYLAAFAAAEERSPAEPYSLAVAADALTAVAQDGSPRLSLRERVDVRPEGLEGTLGLRVEAPLFDSTLAPRRAAAEADLALQGLLARADRDAALAGLLHDLAALAALAPAAAQAERLPSDPLVSGLLAPEPARLPPERRDAYEAAAEALETARWLLAARADLLDGVARRLRVAVADLTPPTPEDIERALAPALHLAARADPLTYGAPRGALHHEPEDAAAAACLERSPALAVAAARRDQLRSAAAELAAPDLRVTLAAELDGIFGGLGSAGAGAWAAASVGVEARYVLPDGWPFAGALRVAAGETGASQELQVSWPPSPYRAPPLPDPDEGFADEAAMALAEARSRLRAAAAARAERERAERTLAWALLDAAPSIPVPEAAALARDPWGEGWPPLPLLQALAVARLRLEASLARAGELSAAVDLAVHCGLLPAAAGHGP